MTLILVFFLNSFAGYLQANFAGIISLFPPHYMHYMVTGQAVSGLFSALANILSIAGDWSILSSAFAYFLCANLTLLATFVLYMFVSRTIFYQFYHAPQNVNYVDSNDSVLTWSLFKIVFGKVSVSFLFHLFTHLFCSGPCGNVSYIWSHFFFLDIPWSYSSDVALLVCLDGRLLGDLFGVSSHCRAYHTWWWNQTIFLDKQIFSASVLFFVF